ncbi:MAG: hypothetical protein JKY56_09905 [Kofleriaceae bacterium]|nr:hypothetical protein [Kofleriaceae bacterium]
MSPSPAAIAVVKDRHMGLSHGVGKSLLITGLLVWGTACGASAHTPNDALHEYAEALRVGDSGKAYSLMSAEFQSRYSRENFETMLSDNRAESEQTAHRLATQSSELVVSAEFEFGMDQPIRLVKQSGKWRIAGNPLDHYSQETPRDTVRSFVRAYKHKRWNIMLRFVPTKYRERMTVAMVQKQFEGPRKAAMVEMMDAIKANLNSSEPDLRDLHKGKHVKLRYGVDYEVELIREQGVWKIERLQ